MRKVGVPETGGQATPDFVYGVKDAIEVMTGLRKNRAVLPTVQTLSFSGTPTQAELQAFNKYVNAWASALVALVKRFDE